MSAETLRRAAALMRERHANIGGSTRWYSVECVGEDQASRRTLGTYSLIHDKTTEVALVRGFSDDRDPVADHIASWNPKVALAVADWLDATARAMGDNDFLAADGSVFAHALAVARAYLGEDA